MADHPSARWAMNCIYFQLATCGSTTTGRRGQTTKEVRRKGAQILMAETIDNLILELLEWLEFRVRTYEETLDAWRTSCPRFPIWEDASDRGLVEAIPDNGHVIVRVTPRGRVLLRESKPLTPGFHQRLDANNTK
jgi:hypothetical protein